MPLIRSRRGVTSVGLSMPAVLFDSPLNPITAAGVLAPTLASQAKNAVVIGPRNGVGAPSVRRFQAGNTEQSVYIAGRVYQSVANINPASTGTTPLVLAQFAALGSTLYNVGDALIVEAGFTVAANTNQKAIGFALNNSLVDSQTTVSAAITGGRLRATFVKTASNTQKVLTEVTLNSAKGPLLQSTNLTEASEIDLQIVGYAATLTTDLTLGLVRAIYEEGVN